jgi:Na+/H+ antiporter NhaD/arsenite permease-like protein
VVNTGLIAWAGMVVTVIFFYLVSRKALAPKTAPAAAGAAPKYPTPREAITNIKMFSLNLGIFLLAIVLLVTHAQTGISVATIGVIAAVLTLAVANKAALHIIKKLDWRTLLFFVGLFVCVGGLEETGVLQALGNYIGNISGGSLFAVITIIIWLSTVLSAFIDNIPFAATMIPVISGIAQTSNLPLHPLAWTLALGTDIGGNATPIGASANVVGTAISEREGYPIGWGRYLKYGVPSTILVVGLCWVLLLLRY